MGSHWGHGTCCSTSVFSNLNFEKKSTEYNVITPRGFEAVLLSQTLLVFLGEM